jgi:mRNA-degrading endonuclease toxin of MazEF toxin-antitoxin module
LSPGDIVWVPFPHVEDNQIRSRPALIVATGLGGALNLCWALMITAAVNPAWPEDVLIDSDPATGLRVLSRIRTAKIATLGTASATLIGRLSDHQWSAVRERLGDTMRESVSP